MRRRSRGAAARPDGLLRHQDRERHAGDATGGHDVVGRPGEFQRSNNRRFVSGTGDDERHRAGDPSRPVRTATVHAQARTYPIKVWTETTDTDCAGHSYGSPVINYLRAHPCSGLTRLLATTQVAGRAVAFAQSSLGFTGASPQVYKTAGDFIKLLNQDNTGSVNDLLREGRRLPGGPNAIPSGEVFRVLGQDAGIAIVDAWYLAGTTKDNDPALIQLAHDIFLQF